MFYQRNYDISCARKTLKGLNNMVDCEYRRQIYLNTFAPVLLEFVEWVLEQAEKRGIYRLYFLARDGYQMYLAATHLCELRNLKIECRYLYGSRYAWRMPQFVTMGSDCLDVICRGGIDVTFEKVLKRGGLINVEIQQVAEELNFTTQCQRILSYSEVLQLKKPLAESKKFLPYVYENSKASYETTIGYFKQEGLFDEVKYALVDSGWTGSLQQTLIKLLEQEGLKKTIEGFYFGLYELPAGVKKEEYHTFYFGPQNGMRRKVYFSNCLYEAVYSAPHGMTIGYEKKGESYVPVFYKEQNLNQSIMEQEKECLKAFLIGYSGRETTNVYHLLKGFMGNPSKEEARAYGNLLFSDDVTEEYTQPVAAKLTKEEVKNQYVWNRILIMLGIKKQELKDSAWMEGSIAMAEGCQAWQMLHVRLYKYLIYFRKWLKRGK